MKAFQTEKKSTAILGLQCILLQRPLFHFCILLFLVLVPLVAFTKFEHGSEKNNKKMFKSLPTLLPSDELEEIGFLPRAKSVPINLSNKKEEETPLLGENDPMEPVVISEPETESPNVFERWTKVTTERCLDTNKL